MQSPALGKEEPLGFPWDGLAGGSSAEKCLGCGEQLTEREPAACPSGNDSILGFVNSNRARKLRKVIILLFSGLARPCLDTASRLDLRYRKDILKME